MTEIEALKEQADIMGIKYHPTIGLLKLKEKIEVHRGESLAATPKESTTPAEETEQQRNTRLTKEANRLVRVRIECMNPAKKNYQGEFFSISNGVFGTIRKYVPFGIEDGWHIPQVLLPQLQERRYRTTVKVRENGKEVKENRLMKEFAIEILPALTQSELIELRDRQALNKSMD